MYFSLILAILLTIYCLRSYTLLHHHTIIIFIYTFMSFYIHHSLSHTSIKVNTAIYSLVNHCFTSIHITLFIIIIYYSLHITYQDDYYYFFQNIIIIIILSKHHYYIFFAIFFFYIYFYFFFILLSSNLYNYYEYSLL